MKGRYYEELRDKERGQLGLENGTVRLRKVTGTYKDFEDTFE